MFCFKQLLIIKRLKKNIRTNNNNRNTTESGEKTKMLYLFNFEQINLRKQVLEILVVLIQYNKILGQSPVRFTCKPYLIRATFPPSPPDLAYGHTFLPHIGLRPRSSLHPFTISCIKIQKRKKCGKISMVTFAVLNIW